MSTSSTPPDQPTPRLFGTDGVRDLAGQGRLAPETLSRLGGALVRFVQERAPTGGVRVLLARDPRPSGEEITAALAGAMQAQGAHVFDAGMVPSPALAWLTAAHGYTLGCMISASHNAEPYNGVKPFLGDARKLTQKEECAVEALMEQVEPAAPVRVGAPAEDPVQAYVEAAVEELRAGCDLTGMSLVVDLSAGAASATAPDALKRLGVRATFLHPAGSRAINDACGTESPAAWLEAVRTSGADAGLAFDGDADRVLVADETGALLDGDDLLAILAADLHVHGGVPAQTVVSTVMANLGLMEFLDERGLELARTAVGDRHVSERMRSLGAVLGGEPAGHVVLSRSDLPGGTALIGDGLVAGVRVLQAARRSGHSLSELRRMRVRRPQLNLNVQMDARRDLATWSELQAAIGEQERALGPGGRFVVRYSGTEPLLRVMAEGREEDAVVRAVETVAAVARTASA